MCRPCAAPYCYRSLARVRRTQDAKPGVHGKPQRGSPTPHGASVAPGGAINFAVFSSGATAVSLVLYTAEDQRAGHVTAEIPLSPDTNRTVRGRRRSVAVRLHAPKCVR